MNKKILWWGRSDPGYSRNRIVRGLLKDLGCQIADFQPLLSSSGDIEAAFRIQERPALLWVPCFRQRDLGAALRYGRRNRIPVIADPLISAWDKQVFERNKFAPGSVAARRLQRWESGLLAACDAVVADTPAHARFFSEALGVPEGRIHVLWVGAEEDLFKPMPPRLNSPVEALFFGSFIGLHGIDTIIEAARVGPRSDIVWTLLGSGPDRQAAIRSTAGLANLRFEEPIPYAALPDRIASADIVLGVFGASEKAGRVIPNKVFQGMASGRPVVTRIGTGYPEACLKPGSGLTFVPPGDPAALAESVMRLANDSNLRANQGAAARRCLEGAFGRQILQQQLTGIVSGAGLI